MKHPFNHHPASRRGSLLIDTLVVLGCTALLTVIAVPVYYQGAGKAKLRLAGAEIRQLAAAEEAVADQFGFYVPLQLLDDVARSADYRTPRTDDIANEPGTIRLIGANADIEGQAGKQPTLGSENERSQALSEQWSGPYAQAKRVHLGGSAGRDLDPATLTAAQIRRDYPLDPWGNPYRFYSPLGLIGSGATGVEASALDTDEFSDGVLTRDDDRFDSFAIVSWGPDGQSDSISKGNDDVHIFLGQEVGSES